MRALFAALAAALALSFGAAAQTNSSSGACGTLTGDVTSVSCATTVAKIAGTTVSGTTGTVNVVFSASSSLTGTTSAQSLSLAPATGLGRAIVSTQTVSGTPSTPYNFNTLSTNSNAVVATGSYTNAWYFAETFGGSGADGGRQGIASAITLSAPTSATNAFRNYTSNVAYAFINSADNGTGLTVNTAKGAFFGYNSEVVAASGATNLLNVTGAEFNVDMQTGSSVYYKSLIQLVGGNTDVVQGAVYDVMLGLSNQTGATGYNDGILLGPMNDLFPLTTSGNVLRTISGAFANGIDFSTSTISGSAFKSPGFTLSGAGTVTTTSGLSVGTATAETGGVVITNTFSANLASAVGIAYSGGAGLFNTWGSGANYSGYAFTQEHSDGSAAVTVLSVSASQVLALPQVTTSTAALDYLCWNAAGGAVTADSAGTCLASLEELKDGVSDTIDPSEARGELLALRPFWGKYKDSVVTVSDHRIQPMFGARETESIDPRLSSYDKDGPDGQLHSVRYMNVTALLTAGYKAHDEDLRALSAQLSDLEARIAKLSAYQKASIAP